MINISDLLQASDCYSQEVTVWVGLHRWRPFLVNIHIKISLGSFSFFFSRLLFIVCRQWRGFALLLGGRQHLYLFAGSLWGLTSNFTRICNFTQTWVSLTSSFCVVMQFFEGFYRVENRFSPQFCCSRLWWRGSCWPLRGRFVFLLASFRMSFLIIILSSVSPAESLTGPKRLKHLHIPSACHRCLQDSSHCV